MAVLSGVNLTFDLANERYCQITGRRDIVGKPFSAVFPELEGSEFVGILNNVYRTGNPFSTPEFRMSFNRTEEGQPQEALFSFNVEPIQHEGVVSGLMIAGLELSDPASARHVVERSYSERERLLRDLEAANNAKDEFFAMLGHELRNPLSPIVTAIGLVKLRSSGKLTRELALIERHVTHLVRLVDDLLDVSKITRGKVQLRKEWVELGTVVAEAIEMASFLLENRGSTLLVHVPRTGLRVRVDAVRISQVVANLLTNAARYTHPGGHIELSAFREKDEIVLCVKDDGIGIAPDILPNIFDMFAQAPRGQGRPGGGLGVGLALVKNLVQLHGGSVSAVSAGLGLGSEFRVRLPARAGSTSSQIPRAEVARSQPGISKRILVVDDNVDAAEVLGDILRSFGHDVAVATEPLAALELAGEFRPEFAVLDIGLPVMDGYTLAKKLHALPSCTGCRMVALTGYGQTSDKARSAAAGFEAHLVKPVDAHQLLEVLASVPQIA